MSDYPVGHRPQLEIRPCTQCGASVRLDQGSCWLCYAPQPATASGERPPLVEHLSRRIPTPHVEGAGFSLADQLFGFLLIGCVILALLIGLYLAIETPGLLGLYLLVIGPAFIITGGQAVVQWGRSGRTRPVQLFVWLLLSITVTVSVMALLLVAAVILLFVTCLQMLGG